jgi:prepilin-type N-terminal cleavage/methylation domain-containing protein
MQTRNSKVAARSAAFTLVELLVAMVLILILATIAVLFVPRMNEAQKANRGADQLQGQFLLAKARALRDRLPTGIRLSADQSSGGGSTLARDMQFIQQPEDFRGGTYIVAQPFPQPNPTVTLIGFINQAPTATFTGSSLGSVNSPDNFAVMPGDYIEFNGGGLLHQILGIMSPPFAPPFNACTSVAILPLNADLPTSPTANYRVIRQPRVIANEEAIQLPQDVAIDFTLSLRVPQRQAYSGVGLSPGGPSPQVYVYRDILFAPSGAIVGQNSGSGNIILYVRDITRDAIIDGDPRLVTIHTHTGLIGVHPIDPTNLYRFTQDARSSGL